MKVNHSEQLPKPDKSPGKDYASLVSLDLEMFKIGVSGVEDDAYCADLVSSNSPGPEDEIACVICRCCDVVLIFFIRSSTMSLTALLFC